MTVLGFIRLIRKHLILLIAAPLFMGGLMILLTLKPDFKYTSETTLFTGIASGSSIEMDKSYNYFANNTAFDNLISVIKSRKAQQEVAIRLLAQFLMLKSPDPEYISEKTFREMKRITPAYIYQLVDKNPSGIQPDIDTSQMSGTDTLPAISRPIAGHWQETDKTEIPNYIDPAAFEKTVQNLTRLMASSDTNFVYELLNYPNAHYSLRDISKIQVQRVANSDLVQLKYETDDPGICQQSLKIMNKVCAGNYRDIRGSRSDAVVRYFEEQLQLASGRLKNAEDKLLQFNRSNNIINYYEQSKAVAVVKEDLEVDYNNRLIKLAGYQAAIKRLEDKMNIREQIQLKSSRIMEMRNQLGDINYKIVAAVTTGQNKDFENIEKLKESSEKLSNDLKKAVSDLYSYGNSKEGVPLNTLLNEWLTNVIEAENTQAGITVLGERIKEFQKQYSFYAPAGATIKRIEREISVSEQEFLEILHGLNLAKLKLQDSEMSSIIKVVDPPYFPINPIPAKRKILVMLTVFLTFLIILAIILLLEYMDQTLKNPVRASRILQMDPLGTVPKIVPETRVPVSALTERLTAMMVQKIEFELRGQPVKTILIFSTRYHEGKTMVAGNIARQLKKNGKKVTFINLMEPDGSSLRTFFSGKTTPKRNLLFSLLGYSNSGIDHRSPFLADPKNYLEKHEYQEYTVNDTFSGIRSISELVPPSPDSGKPEYILLELPAILFHSLPSAFIESISLSVLVCRSNREWSAADQESLNTMRKLTGRECMFILNGTDIRVIESLLGELPEKRFLTGRFRKTGAVTYPSGIK